jgi:hypothetical protein
VAKSYKPIPVASTPDTPYREEDIRPRATILDSKIEKDPLPVTNQAASVKDGLRTNSSNPEEYPDIFNQYAVQSFFMKKNKGMANYISGATSGNQNLAFYNEAESGSVIRVTNLMNHKTIFVKVIGRVPPMDAANEVFLKLSNKSAQDLEVSDQKFLVEVASFFVPDL